MTHHSNHSQREKGAVLIIAAFSMTLLFLIAALVIDLGSTRSDRRGGQLAVDAAATAAGQVLADTTGDGVAACKAAFDYIELTLEVTFDRSVCNAFLGACIDSTVRRTTPQTVGAYTVVLEYPVVDGSPLMVRTSTIGAESMALNPTTDGVGCERFGLALTVTQDSFFGQIAGQDERQSSVHAVVRGIKSYDPFDIPAFLMTERMDCGTIVDQQTNFGIHVSSSSDGVEPGIIHVDSDGSGDCGGVDKDYVVFGSPLPDGTPSITVQAGAFGPGRIHVVAPASVAGGEYPGGLNVPATPNARVVSRIPVDDTYNSAASPAITNLHEQAYDYLFEPQGGFTPIDCSGVVPVTVPPTTKVFVNCPSGYSGAGIVGVTDIIFSHAVTSGTFADARRVAIRGELDIGSGTVLFPEVEELYVGDGVDLANNGVFAVNSATASSCATPGSPAAKFVIFGGDPALVLESSAAICAATVYLGGPISASYGGPRQEVGGAPHSSCLPETPCPKNDGDTTARFEIAGNGTVVTWTAPNLHPGEIPEDELQGLEDLALWTEGTTRASPERGGDVTSSAVLDLTGVLFAPNLKVKMQAPSDTNPRNAQFISQKLWLYQGGVNMQPVRGNAVEIPSFDAFRLIR